MVRLHVLTRFRLGHHQCSARLSQATILLLLLFFVRRLFPFSSDYLFCRLFLPSAAASFNNINEIDIFYNAICVFLLSRIFLVCLSRLKVFFCLFLSSFVFYFLLHGQKSGFEPKPTVNARGNYYLMTIQLPLCHFCFERQLF